MAVYFCSSAGSNTAPFDTEAKAATTLGVLNSLAWTAADTVKISSTHAESTATPSYLFPSTPGLKIVSVLFDGSGTGAITPGASITNSANTTALTLSSGHVYIEGVSFIGNNGASNSNTVQIGAANASTQFVFKDCTFSVPGAGTGRNLIGVAALNVDTKMDFIGCTFSAGANKGVTLRNGIITMDNITFAGTAPTTLFTITTLDMANFELKNSDLSALAWTNLTDVSSAAVGGFFRAVNCKLRASFATVTGSFTAPGFYVEVIDSNSGDVNYYYKKDSYEGTITASNSIYLDASDGSNSLSWQMVSSANASYIYPLRSPIISWMNRSLSAMTTSVEVTNDGTTFKDNELWQETTAKVTSGFPLGTVNRADKSNILAAGANQTSSSVSWTGTGGFGAEVKQKLESGSFTPAETGFIQTQVFLGKASATVYVSPKVLTTSGSQWATPMGGFMNEGTSGSTQRVVLTEKGLMLNLTSKFAIRL